MLKQRRKLLITIIVTGFLLSLLAFEGTKAEVTLNGDGEQQMITTHAKTVGQLLKDQGIKVNVHDSIKPGLNKPISDGMSITYQPAIKITVTENGKPKEMWTTAKTVKQLLDDEKITYSTHDKISPGLNTKIDQPLSIFIDRSFQVKLKMGENTKEVWTTSTTVADFLKQQKIKLNKLDRIEPKLQDKVTEGTLVHVTRVEKVTDVVEEPVDYAVVTKKDSSLQAGSEKVLEQGQKGLVKKYYEVTKENGKEVSRKLVNTEKVKSSKDKVVAVGTKRATAQVSRSGSSPVKTVFMKATAYTAYCNGCSGVTRAGINLRKNPSAKVVAVDPNVIPLGTKLWVEGYGFAVAGDTGGAIKGNRIDLFYPDQQFVDRFGYKTLKVKIYDK